jgi:hypothetical protein
MVDRRDRQAAEQRAPTRVQHRYGPAGAIATIDPDQTSPAGPTALTIFLRARVAQYLLVNVSVRTASYACTVMSD